MRLLLTEEIHNNFDLIQHIQNTDLIGITQPRFLQKVIFESLQSEMTTLEQVNNHAFIVPSNRNELVLK